MKITWWKIIYDINIALDLGACKARTNGTYFNGEDYYRNVIGTTFIGTSGNITFNIATRSCDSMSVIFIFTNIQ